MVGKPTLHKFLAFLFFSLFIVPLYAQDYTKEAETFIMKKQYQKALIPLHKLLLLKQNKGNIYNGLALCEEKLYHYDKALFFYHKAISINDASLQSYNHALMISYNKVAKLYKYLGNYTKALIFYKKALKYKQNSSHQKPKSIAITQNNLAEVYRRIGEYEKAFTYYQKSLKIKHKHLDKMHPSIATTYSNLSGLYYKVGNIKEALIYAYKALEIRKIHKDRLHESYNNLGKLTQSNKDYTKALDYYTLSLKTQAKSTYTAETYNNMAQVHRSLKNNDKAFEYAYKALDLTRKQRGEEHIDLAFYWRTLANIYYDTHSYQKALKYTQKSLTLYQKLLDENHNEIAKTLADEASIYKALERHEEALKSSQKAFDIFMQNSQKNYLFLDSSQKKAYNKHYQSNALINQFLNLTVLTITEMMALASSKSDIKAQQLREEAFKRWLQYKGNISHKENTISIVYHKIKELKQSIDQLKSLRIHLSTLYQTYPRKNDIQGIARLQTQLKETRSKMSVLQIKLNKMNSIFKTLLELQDIDYHDISKALGKHQLYIDFARGIDAYFVFSLDANNTITLEKIDANTTKILEKEIEVFRHNTHAMAKGKEDKEKLHQEVKKTLNTLYKSLNNYIGLDDFKYKQLLISPDGVLNFLPFEALYHENKYLIEEKNISYIPSAKEFIQKKYQEKNTNIKNKNAKVVVFAHPDYDMSVIKKEVNSTKKHSTRASLKGKRLIDFSEYVSDLEGSLKEVQSIQNIYQDALVYRDKNATVEHLLAIINPKVLHISTHGFFLTQQNVNYFQQSGLLLAGANNARFISDTHGIVTALKLSAMELSNTELVVLSACETGLGEIEKAEGIAGLPKAFIQAGARNVMMSLWEVDDKETARLMDYFYASLKKHKNQENYIQALKEAKLQMLKMHPYYWSAFVMNGI